MSEAWFTCEHCGGTGIEPLPPCGVCETCNGKKKTQPHESANDALSDWITRNTIGLVIAFAIAVWVWLGPLRRWAFGDDKK